MKKSLMENFSFCAMKRFRLSDNFAKVLQRVAIKPDLALLLSLLLVNRSKLFLPFIKLVDRVAGI